MSVGGTSDATQQAVTTGAPREARRSLETLALASLGDAAGRSRAPPTPGTRSWTGRSSRSLSRTWSTACRPTPRRSPSKRMTPYSTSTNSGGTYWPPSPSRTPSRTAPHTRLPPSERDVRCILQRGNQLHQFPVRDAVSDTAPVGSPSTNLDACCREVSIGGVRYSVSRTS